MGRRTLRRPIKEELAAAISSSRPVSPLDCSDGFGSEKCYHLVAGERDDPQSTRRKWAVVSEIISLARYKSACQRQAFLQEVGSMQIPGLGIGRAECMREWRSLWRSCCRSCSNLRGRSVDHPVWLLYARCSVSLGRAMATVIYHQQSFKSHFAQGRATDHQHEAYCYNSRSPLSRSCSTPRNTSDHSPGTVELTQPP